jgi:hypothetical protein
MKLQHRLAWTSAFALAAMAASPVATQAAFTNYLGMVITNGTVIITTRSAQDAFWRQQSSSSLWDGDDNKGPGFFSPGDAAMGILLQDHGYITRMLPEKVLTYDQQNGSPTVDWFGVADEPQNYYNGYGGPSSQSGNIFWSAMLVIVSGSGSSADMPPPNTNGIPIIMGEHSCLGDGSTSPPRDHSELFLYRSKSSGNLTSPTTHGLYMKVLAPNHPIMQGIPLDAQGRVKIFRDPYPEENAHTPYGWGESGSPKSNYEISWTAVDCSAGKSIPAPGLTVIGALDKDTNQVVFAVMDGGGTLGDTSDALSQWYGYTKAPARLVHLFVNEGGSGNSRRAFNALTEWGRLIFIRTCKWAMSEELQPYSTFRILDVSSVGAQKVKLAWQGNPSSNYRILGTTDFAAWSLVIDDIPGATNGLVSRTLDISAAPQALFMRVAAIP